MGRAVITGGIVAVMGWKASGYEIIGRLRRENVLWDQSPDRSCSEFGKNSS